MQRSIESLRLMNTFLNHLLLLLLVAAPGIASAAPSQCTPFRGAMLVSGDGRYLGRLTDKYDGESIFNEYGTYGSKYQTGTVRPV